MTPVFSWIYFLLCLILVPPLVLSIIGKTKARLQNRRGPVLLQVFYDWSKLWRKDQTLSSTLSGVFRSTAVINTVIYLSVALFVPWLAQKPPIDGDDLFLLLYSLALARFLCLLASMDAGSAFGAFAASREATLSLLVEPAFMLTLVALAVCSGSTSLSSIFAFSINPGAGPEVWFLGGIAIFLCGLVELSRMPIDDPTTHLELTMVHEAMIVEASGRNLLLLEYSYAMKMTVFLGLSAQCFLHAYFQFLPVGAIWLCLLSVAGIFGLAVLVALIEALSVKLRWRKAPEFIAYALTMSFLACLVSIAKGATFR